jgi:hypothetical protein
VRRFYHFTIKHDTMSAMSRAILNMNSFSIDRAQVSRLRSYSIGHIENYRPKSVEIVPGILILIDKLRIFMTTVGKRPIIGAK